MVEIEIPKPDYSQIRRTKQPLANERVQDPRLRRILSNASRSNKSKGKSKPREESAPQIASPDLVPPKSFLTDPRAQTRTDPRRRREETTSSTTTHISSPSSNTGSATSNAFKPREGQLEMNQLLVMLQKSAWYQDLNSSSKINVNQQLALLSAELKKFNADPSPDKVFDLTYVTSNPSLQNILTSLGVYMDENGFFCQVEDSPKDHPNLPPQLANLLSTPPPHMPANLQLPPNIDLNLLNSLAPLLNAPPPRMPMNTNSIRPSILGIPPPQLPMQFNENLLKQLLPNANAFAQSLFNNLNQLRNDSMRNDAMRNDAMRKDDRGGDRHSHGGNERHSGSSSNQRRDQDRRGNNNSGGGGGGGGNWGHRNNNRRNDYGNQRRKN